MWLFFLYQSLAFVGGLCLLYAYCRFKKLKLFSFIWQNIKHVLLAALTIFLAISILSWSKLYSTTQCYFRGVSMRAETKYSWYLNECQIRTKSGSFVPIRSTRGLPDKGSDDQMFEQEMYDVN